MIDLTRRGLLQGILAGSLLAVPSNVLAILPDRYAELIATQREAIRLTKLYEEIWQKPDNERAVITAAAQSRAVDRDHQRFRSVRDAVIEDIGLRKAMDDVLVVLNTRFNAPIGDEQEARRKVNQLLEGEITIDTLNDRDLRLYEDYLVSIATARAMLQTHAMPLNGHLCQAWLPFVVRHKTVLAG